ncbi:MAG: diaminopimelate epimerase [Bacteroidota bacterium]
MEKYFFTKMSGSGNDFILFDSKINPGLNFSNEKIAQICSRRTGIGADGILIIENAAGYDFEMKYYNADGTNGSLCANGARCSLQYAKLSGLLNSAKARFVFNNKVYSGEVLCDGRVKFDLLPPSKIKFNFKIKTAGQLVNSCYANTGSPHVVIKIEDVLKNPMDINSSYEKIEVFPVYDIGKDVRYHPDFTPEGTNVNFVQIEEGKIKIRTYERGIEDETLSCGTGSVASAVIMFYNGLVNKPVEIVAKSGDQLFVDFNFDGQNFTDVSLTGPAVVVFNGEITT